MPLPERCVSVLLTAVACFAAGCNSNSGPERSVVTGQVKVNGAPLVAGVVKLYPTENSTAPMSAADIVDGKFVVNNLGGAAVGKYRVEINAYKMETSKVAGEVYENRIQYLPAEYNKKSTLTLEVPSGEQGVTKDFELTVDPKLLPREGDTGRPRDPAK
ncbi:MAG TPA: hypothetical protein VM452_11410 [Caulifigura sp.]|nr:hypothetical protein [Caulifigura sp.]